MLQASVATGAAVVVGAIFTLLNAGVALGVGVVAAFAFALWRMDSRVGAFEETLRAHTESIKTLEEKGEELDAQLRNGD